MNVLQLLKAESGRLAKVRLLKAHMTNELKDVFSYTYDYNKVYGIKKVGPINWEDLGVPTQEMFELLDKLLSRDLSGNEASAAISNFAYSSGDLIKLIVRKSLDVGVTAKTFNSVVPNWIPEFKVQLAKEIPLDKIKFPCVAQIKYDGVRIVIIKDGDTVQFRTRNGKTVVLPKLNALFASIEFDFVLDSEVTLASGMVEDRTAVSGLINSAMHGGMIDESLLTFNVFDLLTLEEWKTQTCLRAYDYRYAHLVHMLQKLRHDQVIPAVTIAINDIPHIAEYYAMVIAKGFEGLIIKPTDHRYTFKRSCDWAKLKETVSADLTCFGIIPGEGKYEGMIGSLICEGIVNGNIVKVNVGSGLTNAQRDQGYDTYIGKTIEVLYNTIIQDKTTLQYSLFLPRFVCIRLDK